MNGKQITFDFTYKAASSNKVVAEAIFILMQRAINECSTLKIVHSQLVILPVEGWNSLPGFTSCLLLDSSHMTCHAYSPIGNQPGKMAVDIFSCGETPLMPIIRFLQHGIEKFLSDVFVFRIRESDRF